MQLIRVSPEWADWVATKMEQIIERRDDPEALRAIAAVVLVEARSQVRNPPVELLGVDELEAALGAIVSCATACHHCRVVADDAASALGLTV